MLAFSQIPFTCLIWPLFYRGFCILAHLLKKDMGLGKFLVPCILLFSTLLDIHMIVLFVVNTNITGLLFWASGGMILFGLAILSLSWIVFRRFKIIQPH
jgi:hypothetical protein